MTAFNITVQPKIAALPHSYTIPPSIATLVFWDAHRTIQPRVACVPGHYTCASGDGTHPCDFPWQRDVLGRRCGKRAAVIRPGGFFDEVWLLPVATV